MVREILDLDMQATGESGAQVINSRSDYSPDKSCECIHNREQDGKNHTGHTGIRSPGLVREEGDKNTNRAENKSKNPVKSTKNDAGLQRCDASNLFFHIARNSTRATQDCKVVLARKHLCKKKITAHSPPKQIKKERCFTLQSE